MWTNLANTYLKWTLAQEVGLWNQLLFPCMGMKLAMCVLVVQYLFTDGSSSKSGRFAWIINKREQEEVQPMGVFWCSQKGQSLANTDTFYWLGM